MEEITNKTLGLQKWKIVILTTKMLLKNGGIN
jgi:hypothetical protein